MSTTTKITQATLIARMAEHLTVPRKTIEDFLNAQETIVVAAVQAGEAVTIKGLCVIGPKDVAARQVRNPRNGEISEKPASKGIKVSAVKGLKNAVAA